MHLCVRKTTNYLALRDKHCNVTGVGWGEVVNQAYSRLSTTHGHITDCKLDSVVYAGVGVVI